MSKHTPGPWKIFSKREHQEHKGEAPIRRIKIYKESSAPYTFICDLDFGYGRKEDEANAQLIAKAPEMFEALKETAQVRISDSKDDYEIWAKEMFKTARKSIEGIMIHANSVHG